MNLGGWGIAKRCPSTQEVHFRSAKLSADQGGFPVRGVRQGYLPATVTGVDRRQAVAHEGPIARCCNHFFYRDRDHRTPRTKPSGERFHDGTFWFTMSDGPSSVVRRQLPRTTDHGQNTLGDWGGRKSGTRETELGNEGGLFCRCRPVQQSAVSSQHLSSVPPVPVCRSL